MACDWCVGWAWFGFGVGVGVSGRIMGWVGGWVGLMDMDREEGEGEKG